MQKKRIVIKIGSSSLTNNVGEIDQKKLQDHVQALATLKQAKHEIVLVSSGAVAAGFKQLGYPSRPVTLKGKQAAAAVGQSLLIQSYTELLSKYNIIPAQILLTRQDFSNRLRYSNAFATMTELLERGLLPIINENDTVSVDELTFGDNDMLSALVSGFIHADMLMILTDINGLYSANPHVDPSAKKLDVITDITDDLLKAATGSGSAVGTGGMKSKLLAAKTASSLGVPVFIGVGSGENKFLEILQGNGNGTYVTNQALDPITTKRQWIALHSEATGKLYIDEGAEDAILYKGKSLLPAGVFKVKGTFEKGDIVEVYSVNGLLGRGEVTSSSSELKEYLRMLHNEKYRDSLMPTIEIIHRDCWVAV